MITNMIICRMSTDINNIKKITLSWKADLFIKTLLKFPNSSFIQHLKFLLFFIFEKSSAVEDLTLHHPRPFWISRRLFKKIKVIENDFKNWDIYAYFRAENIVAKGNIAQFEQYFLGQPCFQMWSAAMTDKSVLGCWWVKT